MKKYKKFSEFILETPYQNDIDIESGFRKQVEEDPYEKYEKRKPFTTLKGHNVYRCPVRGFVVTNPKTRKVTGHIGLWRTSGKNYEEGTVATTKDNKLKVHDLYHHLAMNHGYTIHGVDHSAGMRKVWQKLSKKRGTEVFAKSFFDKDKPTKLANFDDYYSGLKISRLSPLVVRKKK